MHDLAPLLCHFSINAPIPNWLSINIKMKRPHATSKSLPQPLTGCCFISDGKNENSAEGREKEGSPAGAPSGSAHPSQEEMRRRERQLEGLEVVGMSPGSLPTWLLRQMAVEVGSSTSSGEASHVRPTVGRNAPCKEFCQGGWRGPRGTRQGQWLSMRYASTRRVPSSSSVSGPLHAWSMR